MTLEQAKDILRQYYRVRKAAGADADKLTLPKALDDAKALLSDDAIVSIEEEVNGEG